MARKNVIHRRIQFFTTSLGQRTATGFEPQKDQGLLWKRIAALPYEASRPGGSARNREIEPDIFEAVQVFPRTKAGGFHGRFYRTKHTDFPLVARGEQDHPLHLDDESGLRHPAHFIWWDATLLKESKGIPAPPVGILGMELNVLGPRARGLAHYAQHILGPGLDFEVQPLIDPEVWRVLKKEPYVRRLTARVLMTERKLGAKEGSLAGLDVPDQLEGVQSLEWTAKPKRRGLLDLTPLWGRIRGFMQSEQVDKLAVTLRDGQSLDLLDSMVTGVGEVSRPRDGSRSVVPDSMYEAIDRAYEALGDRIVRGLGRNPDA